jgi:hypothetical protein
MYIYIIHAGERENKGRKKGRTKEWDAVTVCMGEGKGRRRFRETVPTRCREADDVKWHLSIGRRRAAASETMAVAW